MSSFENNDKKTIEKKTENNHSCNTDFTGDSERRYTLKEFFRIIAEDTDIPEELDDKMKSIVDFQKNCTKVCSKNTN